MAWPLLALKSAELNVRRNMSPRERLMQDQRSLRFQTNLAIVIAVAVGIVVVWYHGGAVTVGIAAFGAALGLGGVLGFLFGVPGASRGPITITGADTVAIGTGPGASAVSGNVDTGQPSAATGDQPQGELAVAAAPAEPGAVAPAIAPPGASAQPATAAAPVPAPSNLEQVADWVTKLLLGGGLTQMQRIPPKVWQWARMIALGIIGQNDKVTEQMVVAQQVFAAELLVYGFILGFFSGFLITKLQLGKAISD